MRTVGVLTNLASLASQLQLGWPSYAQGSRGTPLSKPPTKEVSVYRTTDADDKYIHGRDLSLFPFLMI